MAQVAQGRGAVPALNMPRGGAAQGPALRTPRPVDFDGSQAMKSSRKASATNDEVARILKGLQLDRDFFASRIKQEPLMDLVGSELAGGQARRIQRVKSKRGSTMSASGPTADVDSKRGSAVRGSGPQEDFDIYLNEAVMPVLAQALDSLCRQLARMEQQGDQLDPKVRARFNPLTWVAQQLLRGHPKCARTPRRQAIYKNFADWADLERGRRAVLRRREVVQTVFNGFMLAGKVRRDTIPSVLAAIDDTLHLGGILSGSEELQTAVLPQGVAAPIAASAAQKRGSLFKGEQWSFEQFWHVFAKAIMTHDIVPYSAVKRGIQLQQEAALALDREGEAQKLEEEARLAREQEQRKLMSDYAELHEELKQDEHLRAILQDNKILTGDDVRPDDAGYEFEVPPNGPHVSLLAKFLAMLGFGIKPSDAPERWWDAELASAWTILQELHHADLKDGVVEREILEKILVPPVGFMLLRYKVEDELERRADDEDERADCHKRESLVEKAEIGGSKKPSMEQLCKKLGMTMARLHWLHQLFESFLEPEEGQDPSLPPCCLYPDCPAALKRPQMHKLMIEINPSMTEAEFQARFSRIDKDGSGMIEFDEFVTWVRQDEVHIEGTSCKKMSIPELAEFHDQPVEVIEYLFSRFQHSLPGGQSDGYPDNPILLPKADASALVSSLAPDMLAEEFEDNFAMADSEHKGAIAFDDFLDVLDFDALPEELVTQ